MNPNDNNQASVQAQSPPSSDLTTVTPQPQSVPLAQPLQQPLQQSSAPVFVPKPKPKKRLIFIILIAIVSVVLLFVAFTYNTNRSDRTAGLKKADDFVALLEANNKDALKNEIFEMLDTNDQTTDPQKLEELSGVAVQISFVANILQKTDAEMYSDSFGTTTDGKKMATAYYKFSVSSDTGYYKVSTRKENSKWVLHSVQYTTTDPTTKK